METKNTNKVFLRSAVIAICFGLAAALITQGGNVIVKNGELNVSNDFYAGSNTLYVNSTSGNVGIGTTGPRTKLELNNDGAILAVGTYGSGWTEPNLGAGTRLLWYPRKAAFRAGYVSSTQWNNANIGDYSVAFGKDTKVCDGYSLGAGQGTYTGGSWSFVVGQNSHTTSHYGAAMNFGTTAGYMATAMGYSTTASGSHSVAMGYSTTASGAGSVAMGYSFTNNIANSLGIGYNDLDILLNSNGDSYFNAPGNVGIGTTSPVQRLDIWNVTRLNPTDAPGTCNTTYEGSLYYDASLRELCYCNSTTWNQADGGGTC